MEKEWEMSNPLTVIKGLGSAKSEAQGVVKRDWVSTGRIDFATNIDSDGDPNQPSEFKLLVEERRIIESVAGNEHLEIQWRLATLKEVKIVAAQYQKYLTENSLIRDVFDPEIFPPEPNTRVNSHSTSRQFAGPPAFLAGQPHQVARIFAKM